MKKIILVMPHMVGGGAERVGSLLMDRFFDNGHDCEVVLTSDRASDVVRCDLYDEIPLTLLPEILPEETFSEKLIFGVALKLYAQIACNLFELFGRPVPADFAKASLFVQYHREIAWLRRKLQSEPDTAVIAFLQPVIPVVMLAARGLPNRVVFSERGDPGRLMKKRYGRKFIAKYYKRADAAVFQTGAAKAVYPENISEKGVVIPNPLKEGLPKRFEGVRQKRVVTFCRISPEKNLPLLVEAFSIFRSCHPDYTLCIYGDAANDAGREVITELNSLISEKSLDGAVELRPFSADVHAEVVFDAMYVNSSDTEGLSNAMLEALAIGLPCVCTDCPVGGALSVIEDGENGILVPVGDAEKMSDAMCRIAADPLFSEKLSKNAARLRDKLSLDAVAEEWERLL